MKPTTLTVFELNRKVRSFLEEDIGEVSVLGELSNLSTPASGHWYFTLKDEKAQIRCAFFRNYHTEKNQQYRDGQQVLAKGRVSLYEARGDYQLLVREMTPAGLGELYRQFELLKEQLAKAGLFSAERKQSFPRYPSTIGIVTSPHGAAIKDILSTLERRFPLTEILIYPCEVQGAKAAPLIAKAIQKANQDAKADALIVARGGGSLEDLWAFNEEIVAYAIFESKIPIVTGVGHETDITIADFVADLRAETPTAAATRITPDKEELLAYVQVLCLRMHITLQKQLKHQKLALLHYQERLSSPKRQLLHFWQTLDFLEKHLHQAIGHYLHQKTLYLQLQTRSLEAQHPASILTAFHTQLQQLQQALSRSVLVFMQTLQQNFVQKSIALHALSPLKTLERGYAIATYQGRVLFGDEPLTVGTHFSLRLAQSVMTCSFIKKDTSC